jgi:hypothetical protein
MDTATLSLSETRMHVQAPPGPAANILGVPKNQIEVTNTQIKIWR